MELTELEATVETIKLWLFLASDGSADKADYFITKKEIPYLGCYLCEYFLRPLMSADYELYSRDVYKHNVCQQTKCPLRFSVLCAVGNFHSAYYLWWLSKDPAERVKYAAIIANAAKRHYHRLTGKYYPDGAAEYIHFAIHARQGGR